MSYWNMHYTDNDLKALEMFFKYISVIAFIAIVSIFLEQPTETSFQVHGAGSVDVPTAQGSIHIDYVDADVRLRMPYVAFLFSVNKFFFS